MTKVMTINTENSTTEVYLLSPGDHFPGFGGSKSGLVVGSTPSLVTRQYDQSGSMNDIEHDFDSESAWEKIKKLVQTEEYIKYF